MGSYTGITHFCPLWALGIWRRFLCPKHMHCWDEVASFYGKHPENFLSCDACGLMVWIEKVDWTYSKLPQP